MPKPIKIKSKVKKNVPVGLAYVHATRNNTIITFTDPQGNVVAWSSSGAIGYKGSKKSTPYAAQLACNAAVTKAKECGMKEVQVVLKGIGSGKAAAARQLEAADLKITKVTDATPIPHNGTRPTKRVLKRRKK